MISKVDTHGYGVFGNKQEKVVELDIGHAIVPVSIVIPS